MRRGFIAVGGKAGDFTGVNMLAGTIVVLGELGIRTGAGMRRGTIVSFEDAPMLPSFDYSCTYHPLFYVYIFRNFVRMGLREKFKIST